MSWVKAKLSDVAPAKPLKIARLDDEDIVWQLNLDQIEADTGRLLECVIQPYSKAGSSTHWFDERYVLYSKLRPYLNKVLLPNQRGLGTTELVPLLPDAKRLDRKYLAFYLRSKEFVEWVSMQTAGAKMPRVSMKLFWAHEIPLPPLAEQQKIAAILDAADSIRQKDQQLVERYTALSQSLFLEMFGGIFHNPFKYKVNKLETLIKHKSDLVDGPFGSSIDTEIDYCLDGEIPVIRTKNISIYNEFKTIDLKFMRREKYEQVIRSQVLPGDIVLTKVGTIGNVCIMPNTFKEAVLSTTGSCRIRVDETLVNKKYLLHYLNFYKPKMMEIASAGVQPFLNMSHIKGFDIICPPIQLQNKFYVINEHIEAQKQQAQRSLEKSEALFNSLLQRAFTGELTAKMAA